MIKKLECTMCILTFSSFSAEINNCRMKKLKCTMCILIHPDPSWVPPAEFFPPGWNCILTGWSFFLAGWSLFLLFLNGWSLFLAGWRLFLAGWSFFLAGWGLFLAGWSLFLAGWSFFLAGWSDGWRAQGEKAGCNELKMKKKLKCTMCIQNFPPSALKSVT